MKRIVSILILCAMLFSISGISASAADGISPRFNNLSSADATFNIDSNGNATVYVSYFGYKGVTTGARITILLEKNTFFFFWTDVQEWVITSSEYYGNFTRSCSVSDGDYRVTVTFEISGSGGSTDVFERELEYSY